MTKRFWLLLLAVVIGVTAVRADDRILVDAKLNGQPLKLAFDTGAGGLIIFRTFAEQRGLKVLPPPADVKVGPGQILMGLSEPVTIEFLGTDQSFTGQLRVLDDPSILNFFDIDGVVGWPVTRKNVWFLKGSTLQMTGLSEVPPEITRWVIKLRELRDRETLCLELPNANQGNARYLGIDTGADHDVALSPEAWKGWRTHHRKQPVTLEAYYMPKVNFVVGEIAWADEIDLGGVTLRGVMLREMNEVEIALNPPRTIASLGLGAMKRMDSAFDGKNGLAYFLPLNTPAPVPVHNLLGAVFVPTDLQSDDLLAHVAKGSPAEKAGVRNNDVLLKIDQLDVTRWRTQPGILPLRRFFEQAPGTKLHLTLRRNGKVVAADALLRNIIGPESKTR